MARSRPQPGFQPVAAQVFSGRVGVGLVIGHFHGLHHLADECRRPGSCTGLRYLSARSKAFWVNSTASCTEEGASTSMR